MNSHQSRSSSLKLGSSEAVTASVFYWLTTVQPGRPLCVTDTNLTCSAVPLDDFKFTFQ